MNKKYVKYSLGEIIIVGLRILQAYIYIIENNKHISKSEEFLEVINFAEKEVKKARIELAVNEYNGIVPANVYENIKEDNKETVYILFKEMLEKEGY